MRLFSSLVAVLALGATACTDGDLAAIADLEDGARLTGAQVTRLEVDESIAVTRVELFLDDQVLAADEDAPFEMRWTAGAYLAGTYLLRALVHGTDGALLEASVTVRLDGGLARRGSDDCSGSQSGPGQPDVPAFCDDAP